MKEEGETLEEQEEEQEGQQEQGLKWTRRSR